MGCWRMNVSRLPTAPTATTHNNRNLPLRSSSNRPNQRVRWHNRDANVVPVVASVGSYDASSRIDWQKLVCGSMYVWIPSPEHAHRSKSNYHQAKLREKVTHPGCTLGYCKLYLLVIDACVGAYDASSRIDRYVLYVSPLPTTPTTTINDQLPPDTSARGFMYVCMWVCIHVS